MHRSSLAVFWFALCCAAVTELIEHICEENNKAPEQLPTSER